jgi:molecular chaperone DnaK
MAGAVVGIDLGTTNTVVAAVRGGKAIVLADEEGHRLLPSVVSFHPNGEVLVGHRARERRLVDARNTVYSIKRLIGRSWSSEEVSRARARFPFELREGPTHGPLVFARNESYTLPEISAFVLRRAREIAERALGEPVERAVVTVPASFNDLQRASTKVAAREAGLEVLRILNEPTAAALAYGFGKSGSERIAVYDFGGGTFDLTLLDLSGNVFEVIATAGDSFLGGDDVDLAIADHMAQQLLQMHRYDPRGDVQAMERLRAAAEQVKIALSTQNDLSIDLKEVGYGVGGAAIDFSFTMSRAELEKMIAPLVERTFTVCTEALGLARLGVDAFDNVILVGGSTRIPLVRRRVEQTFARRPMDRVNPDEVVAIGAAIQAAALTGAERRRQPTPANVDPNAVKSTRIQTLGGVAKPASNRPPPMAGTPGSGPSRSTGRIVTSPLSSGEVDARPAPLTNDASGEWMSSSELKPLTGSNPAYAPPPAAASAAAPPAPLPTMPLGAMSAPSVPRSTAREIQPPVVPPPAFEPTPPPGPIVAAPPPMPDLSPEPMQLGRLAAQLPPLTPPVRTPPPPALLTPLGMPAYQPASTPPVGAPPSYLPAVHPQHAPLANPTFGVGAPASSASSMPAPLLGDAFAPPLLIDVTPLSLAVETVGGYVDRVIERNTPVPCAQTRVFTTSSDNQSMLRIRVCQGEGGQFFENTSLGELELSGLRPAVRGELEVEVTFELDADGILQVRARDLETQRQTSARMRLIGMQA